MLALVIISRQSWKSLGLLSFKTGFLEILLVLLPMVRQSGSLTVSCHCFLADLIILQGMMKELFRLPSLRLWRPLVAIGRLHRPHWVLPLWPLPSALATCSGIPPSPDIVVIQGPSPQYEETQRDWAGLHLIWQETTPLQMNTNPG